MSKITNDDLPGLAREVLLLDYMTTVVVKWLTINDTRVYIAHGWYAIQDWWTCCPFVNSPSGRFVPW